MRRKRCWSTPRSRSGCCPRLRASWTPRGVELVGDERARAAAPDVAVGEASDEDWDTEFHDLKLAIGVVDGARARRSSTSTAMAPGIPTRS